MAGELSRRVAMSSVKEDSRRSAGKRRVGSQDFSLFLRTIMCRPSVSQAVCKTFLCGFAVLLAPCCFAETIEIEDAQVSLIQNTFIATPIAGVVAEVFVAEGDQV